MRTFLTQVAVLLFLLAGLTTVQAQTALGLDLEINQDLLTVEDSGNELSPSQRLNVSPGIAYRHWFRNSLSFSTGIRMKQYPESITFKRFIRSSSSGNVALQVPLVFGKVFRPYYAIRILPEAGATLNMFLFDQPGWGSGSVRTATDSIRYRQSTDNTQSYFVTFNAGLSFEFRLSTRLSMAVFCRYNFGLRPVSYERVSYRVNGGPETDARQVNKGNYVTYAGFRLFYHFKKWTVETAMNKQSKDG